MIVDLLAYPAVAGFSVSKIRGQGPAVQPYPAPVVVPVPKAAGGSFHLLDQPVRALGAGVGQPGAQEHLDGRPPGLDRLGEGGELGDLRVGAPLVERPEPVTDLVAVPAAGGGRAQLSEFLLRDPRRQDLPGRVVVDAAVPHSREGTL